MTRKLLFVYSRSIYLPSLTILVARTRSHDDSLRNVLIYMKTRRIWTDLEHCNDLVTLKLVNLLIHH